MIDSLDAARLGKIHDQGIFFAIQDTPCHATLCLMEGLQLFGIPLFSNHHLPCTNFHEFQPEFFALYVFNMTEKSMNGPLLPFLAGFSRREKILVSMADTNSTIFPDQGYPSLMTHENRFLKLAGNRQPWAFGISLATLEKTKNPPPFRNRRRMALRNFRPSANQDIRNFLDFSFLKSLEKHIPVDRTIGSNHFDRLQGHMVCLAYGGSVQCDYSSNPHYANQKGYQAFMAMAHFESPLVITRWDSWRFWESLSAGCLTLHLDFEKYGFQLPEMPEAWKHYIPIDLADPVGSVDRMMEVESRWEEIANTGRLWAIANYGPEAVAHRLLQLDSVEFKH